MQLTKISGTADYLPIASFTIPSRVGESSNAETSNQIHYYKTMTTWKQLRFSMLTGLVWFPKTNSLSIGLCKLFTIPWNEKLTHLWYLKTPASSTAVRCQLQASQLSVVGYIYYLLLAHYQKRDSEGVIWGLPINKELMLIRFKAGGDSTTLRSISQCNQRGTGRTHLWQEEGGVCKGTAVFHW